MELKRDHCLKKYCSFYHGEGNRLFIFYSDLRFKEFGELKHDHVMDGTDLRKIDVCTLVKGSFKVKFRKTFGSRIPSREESGKYRNHNSTVFMDGSKIKTVSSYPDLSVFPRLSVSPKFLNSSMFMLSKLVRLLSAHI